VSHDVSRRSFLGTSVAALGGASLAGCVTSKPALRSTSRIWPGSKILFQGDSITDARRSREHASQANRQEALGSGYAWLAASSLLVQYSSLDLQIYNRGVSGNKVFQLSDRWDEDCLALEPNLLSILIGLNDIWHARNGEYDGTVEVYERDYHTLIERTRASLPRTSIVICEPFVLRCGAVDETWFPEFDEYRAAARRVAQAHDATWVGFQAMFDEAIQYAPPEHWAEDGVHPSSAGAALMAQTWLDAVS